MWRAEDADDQVSKNEETPEYSSSDELPDGSDRHPFYKYVTEKQDSFADAKAIYQRHRLDTQTSQERARPVLEDLNKPPETQNESRAYWPCESCRVRRVKCDSGSFEGPRKPPCARCIEADLLCVFTERGQRSTTVGELDDLDQGNAWQISEGAAYWAQQQGESLSSAQPTRGALISESENPSPPRAEKVESLIQDDIGVHWVKFEYSRGQVRLKYTIRCDVNSVNVNDLSGEFKSENCIYPRACVPEDQYKGNRFRYETECNQAGWALAALNPDLRGKSGLIQRAVDAWRNIDQRPKSQDRDSLMDDVLRNTKSNPDLSHLKQATATAGFGSEQPNKHVSFELLLDEGSKKRARIPLRVSLNAHDTTESIIITVKNFYGINDSSGVSFEDVEANALIPSYDNLSPNMTVYVRCVGASLLPPSLDPDTEPEPSYHPPSTETGQALDVEVQIH